MRNRAISGLYHQWIGGIAKKYRCGQQGLMRPQWRETQMDWAPLTIDPASSAAVAGPHGLIDHLRSLDVGPLLVRHKALVFRGFQVTPAELNEVIDLLLPNRLAYVHGNSP